MAKRFACRVMTGESVTVRVNDSTARLILSKDGIDEIPTVLLQASSTTLVASGAGNTMSLTCDDGAGMHLITDGADMVLENDDGQIIETAQVVVINGTPFPP